VLLWQQLFWFLGLFCGNPLSIHGEDILLLYTGWDTLKCSRFQLILFFAEKKNKFGAI